MVRILVYTGKGGVGKTSIAAASAILCAARGYKTWNFAVLAGHAAKIKGFDLLNADIEEARQDGWDIEVGDAQTYISPDLYHGPGVVVECPI